MAEFKRNRTEPGEKYFSSTYSDCRREQEWKKGYVVRQGVLTLPYWTFVMGKNLLFATCYFSPPPTLLVEQCQITEVYSTLATSNKPYASRVWGGETQQCGETQILKFMDSLPQPFFNNESLGCCLVEWMRFWWLTRGNILGFIYLSYRFAKSPFMQVHRLPNFPCTQPL
jgi:hypothetical protein